MLQIDQTIISLDIIEKKFCCDLEKCKGACCVIGDSGAPLKKEEGSKLEEIFDTLRPYLRKEGIKAIQKQGAYVIDSDGDMVTPLINNKECAYTYFENGIAKCAIEKAFINHDIDFQKPISCYLYPIRVTNYSQFDALNYHVWDICKPAIKKGNTLDTPIYIFLKEPLIKEYGDDWYKQLQFAADEYLRQKNNT